MELVGSRAGYAVECATLGPPVRCGLVIGHNSKFLYGIDTQRDAERISRSCVVVIVYGNSVDTKIVRIGSAASDGHRRAIASGGPLRTVIGCVRNLKHCRRVHTRFESSQRGPITAVQR